MWTWLQELRKGGVFDYAGCIGVPRILTLHPGKSLPHCEIWKHYPSASKGRVGVPQNVIVSLAVHDLELALVAHHVAGPA